MNLQFLRYVIEIAETGSITEASRRLHIAQPSLSNALKTIEREVGFDIFSRSHTGIALTKEGVEFLGYARGAVRQMDALENRFVAKRDTRQRFCISTQHFTFTANAFVEMAQAYGEDSFELILNETQTRQILEDARNRFCDLGILALRQDNATRLLHVADTMGLCFCDLFTAAPHVFLRADHPLANRGPLTLDDLAPYPRLNFLQGLFESPDYAEEPFSDAPAAKIIRVSDRATVVNLMLGLDGYTVSSGIFPRYLQNNAIIAVPLAEEETLRIGYVTPKGSSLSPLARAYIDALMHYDPNAASAEAQNQ